MILPNLDNRKIINRNRLVEDEIYVSNYYYFFRFYKERRKKYYLKTEMNTISEHITRGGIISFKEEIIYKTNDEEKIWLNVCEKLDKIIPLKEALLIYENKQLINFIETENLV